MENTKKRGKVRRAISICVSTLLFIIFAAMIVREAVEVNKKDAAAPAKADTTAAETAEAASSAMIVPDPVKISPRIARETEKEEMKPDMDVSEKRYSGGPRVLGYEIVYEAVE